MSYPTEVAADTPLGYWRLGESQLTDTAVDEMGWKDGAYIGTPILGQVGAVVGDSDTAMKCDQAGNMKCIGNTNLGDLFSIEFAIQVPDTVYGYVWAMSGGGTTPMVRWSSSSFPGQLGLVTPGGVTVAKVATSLTVDTWHHVVFTKNGSSTHAYLDGIDDTQLDTNATFGAPTAGGDLFWGVNPNGSSSRLKGLLDEVAIYTTELSAARVAAHYTALAGGAVNVEMAALAATSQPTAPSQISQQLRI